MVLGLLIRNNIMEDLFDIIKGFFSREDKSRQETERISKDTVRVNVYDCRGEYSHSIYFGVVIRGTYKI